MAIKNTLRFHPKVFKNWHFWYEDIPSGNLGRNKVGLIEICDDGALIHVCLFPGGGTVAAKKRCRVLYSYVPKHEDELELKVDDVIDFEAEVEDGWWKGSLVSRCIYNYNTYSRRVLVVSSPTATEETGSVCPEVESLQGISRVLCSRLKNT
jgi:hypothetical protein